MRLFLQRVGAIVKRIFIFFQDVAGQFGDVLLAHRRDNSGTISGHSVTKNARNGGAARVATGSMRA
jgi:hypothetical protein